MSETITLEQSRINQACAADAAIHSERARVTAILTHPQALERFDLARQLIADGVHVVEACAALGPVADGTAPAAGTTSAPGASEIAASWAKAFAAKSEAGDGGAPDSGIAASWAKAFAAKRD